MYLVHILYIYIYIYVSYIYIYIYIYILFDHSPVVVALLSLAL